MQYKKVLKGQNVILMLNEDLTQNNTPEIRN